ncbi:hypothetical protein HQ571_01615 [Candidatus Kuenenbacteria bacterium]|nr:hypothetical protein [Candidatus Kuenenbacteria bacterium]
MKTNLRNFAVFTLICAFCLTTAPAFAQDAGDADVEAVSGSSEGEALPTEEIVLTSELENLISEEEAVSEEAIKDEEVSEEDLGVEQITRMPSGFAMWWNGVTNAVGTTFTFDPIKKAERQLNYANKKMAQAKYIADNAVNEKTAAKAAKHVEKATRIADKLKNKISTIKADPEKLKKFQEKYTKNLVQHHRILKKLEGQVPDHAFEKIKQAKENRLEHLQNVFEKIDNNDQEKIAERLRLTFQKIKGSDLQPLTDLEFIQELKEKYPEKKREIFSRIEYLRNKSLSDNLKAMSEEERSEKLENYINHTKIKNEKIKEQLLERRHTLLENLETSKDFDPKLKASLKAVKEKTVQHIKQAKQLHEKKLELKEKAEAGDESAKENLENLNKKQKVLYDKKVEVLKKARNKVVPALKKVNQKLKEKAKENQKPSVKPQQPKPVIEPGIKTPVDNKVLPKVDVKPKSEPKDSGTKKAPLPKDTKK